MADRSKVKDWSIKRLQSYVKTSVTKMFEGMLDFSEVAVGEENRYKALRSKILRLANDAIRNINNEIEANYDVFYNGIGEEVIKVRSGREGASNNDRK